MLVNERDKVLIAPGFSNYIRATSVSSSGTRRRGGGLLQGSARAFPEGFVARVRARRVQPLVLPKDSLRPHTLVA